MRDQMAFIGVDRRRKKDRRRVTAPIVESSVYEAWWRLQPTPAALTAALHLEPGLHAGSDDALHQRRRDVGIEPHCRAVAGAGHADRREVRRKLEVDASAELLGVIQPRGHD